MNTRAAKRCLLARAASLLLVSCSALSADSFRPLNIDTNTGDLRGVPAGTIDNWNDVGGGSGGDVYLDRTNVFLAPTNYVQGLVVSNTLTVNSNLVCNSGLSLGGDLRTAWPTIVSYATNAGSLGGILADQYATNAGPSGGSLYVMSNDQWTAFSPGSGTGDVAQAYVDTADALRVLTNHTGPVQINGPVWVGVNDPEGPTWFDLASGSIWIGGTAHVARVTGINPATSGYAEFASHVSLFPSSGGDVMIFAHPGHVDAAIQVHNVAADGGLGNVTIRSNLTVTGSATINGAVQMNSTLVVAGSTATVCSTGDGPTNKVGIGFHTPEAALDIRVRSQDGPGYDGLNNPANGIIFGRRQTGADFTHAGIWTEGSSGYNGDLLLGVDGDSTAATAIEEKMRIRWDGQIGIRTNTPQVALHVVSSTNKMSATGVTMWIEAFGNQAPDITFRSANGTPGSPSAVNSGKNIGGFGVNGYGSTAWSVGKGQFICWAAENWTDAAQGTYWTLNSTIAGTNVIREAMRVHTNGYIGVANAAPTVALDVTGAIKASLNSTFSGGLTVAGGQTAQADTVNLTNLTVKGNTALVYTGPSFMREVNGTTAQADTAGGGAYWLAAHSDTDAGFITSFVCPLTGTYRIQLNGSSDAATNSSKTMSGKLYVAATTTAGSGSVKLNSLNLDIVIPNTAYTVWVTNYSTTFSLTAGDEVRAYYYKDDNSGGASGNVRFYTMFLNRQ